MNFLALPFLFPILVITAIVLCPIETSKLIYGCVTGFRHDIVSHMTIGERVRSFLCVFAMASEMNVKRRLGQIVGAVKVAASWLVVLALCAGLVAPAVVLGIVGGVVGYVVGVVYELAKDTSTAVMDSISDVLDAAVSPASRSCRA